MISSAGVITLTYRLHVRSKRQLYAFPSFMSGFSPFVQDEGSGDDVSKILELTSADRRGRRQMSMTILELRTEGTKHRRFDRLVTSGVQVHMPKGSAHSRRAREVDNQKASLRPRVQRIQRIASVDPVSWAALPSNSYTRSAMVFGRECGWISIRIGDRRLIRVLGVVSPSDGGQQSSRSGSCAKSECPKEKLVSRDLHMRGKRAGRFCLTFLFGRTGLSRVSHTPVKVTGMTQLGAPPCGASSRPDNG